MSGTAPPFPRAKGILMGKGVVAYFPRLKGTDWVTDYHIKNLSRHGYTINRCKHNYKSWLKSLDGAITVVSMRGLRNANERKNPIYTEYHTELRKRSRLLILTDTGDRNKLYLPGEFYSTSDFVFKKLLCSDRSLYDRAGFSLATPAFHLPTPAIRAAPKRSAVRRDVFFYGRNSCTRATGHHDPSDLNHRVAMIRMVKGMSGIKAACAFKRLGPSGYYAHLAGARVALCPRGLGEWTNRHPEALRAGTFVISSPISHLEFSTGWKKGIHYEEVNEDLSDFEELIRRALDDEPYRRRIADAARLNYAKQFTPARMYEMTWKKVGL